MNKYEDVNYIKFDNPEDIAPLFIHDALNADYDEKTNALIANKDLVLYIMYEALSLDEFNVQKIDMELSDVEYIIIIDEYGNLIVQPVSYCTEKLLSNVNFMYISMDGDVSNNTIDTCFYMNKDIVLFGLCDDCDDDEITTFSYSVYNDDTGYSSVSFSSNDKGLVEKMARLQVENTK